MTDNSACQIDENISNHNALESENYPYLRRQTKTQITNCQAFFLLLQGLLGTGMLEALIIFREGWITGIVFTVLVCVLCTHCLHIMIRAKYRICKNIDVHYLSYSQAMERALETGPPKLRTFSKTSHHVIDVCFIFCQLSLCCRYALFAVTWCPLITQTFASWLNVELNTMVFVYASLVPLLLAVFMKDLRAVAKSCILGILILLGSLGFFYWYLLKDSLPFDNVMVNLPDISPAGLNYLGQIFLSMEAVTVVASFEGNLKSLKTFTKPWGILNLGMLIAVGIQCTLGFLGSLKFVNYKVENMDMDAVLDDTAKIGIGLFANAMYISYGLQGYILVDILWKKTPRRKLRTKYFLRILLLLITGIFLAAMSVMPLLAACIINVTLGITVSLLGIIFPAVMDICINWPHNFRRAKLLYWKNMVLILIGMFIIIITIVPATF